MKTNWIYNQTYDHKPKITPDDLRQSPEDYGLTKKAVEKVTVPGQSLSVKEIMKRS